MLQKIVLVGTAAALSACYSMHPLTTIPPLPATHVVAQLTDSGTVAMGNALGQGVVAFQGIVQSATKDIWNVEMVSAEQRDGRTVAWNHEPVAFPSYALRDPQQRILDKRRSWTAGVGLVVGAFLASRAFKLLNADDSKDETPEPAAILIGAGGK